MGGTLLRNPHMFENLWGVYGIHNVLLVTTMWDDIQQVQGIYHEEELMAKPWNLMLKAGSRVLRFGYNYESAWSIVEQIPGPLRNLIIQFDKLRAKSQEELQRFRHQDGKTRFPNLLSASIGLRTEPGGKLSATILALRDAQGVAKIYRLPSLKDAVDLCLALTESIEVRYVNTGVSYCLYFIGFRIHRASSH